MSDPIDASSHFSPYRSDGKLVRPKSNFHYKHKRLMGTWHCQYGFVCVVTGATQPIGQAIVGELAGALHASVGGLLC